MKQDVELLPQEKGAVEAILVLDSSASVRGLRLRELQRAAHGFVDALRPSDSVSLVGFSWDLTLAARAGSPREETRAAIDRFYGTGATSLRDAVYAALLLSDPARGRPLVLVFSDGVDHGSWLGEEAVLATARSTDAVVHYLTVGKGGDSFLKKLARETGGRGFEARRERDLRGAFVAALEEFRSRYRLRYEPRGGAAGGWHALRIRLAGKKGDVTARRGYQVRRGRGIGAPPEGRR